MNSWCDLYKQLQCPPTPSFGFLKSYLHTWTALIHPTSSSQILSLQNSPACVASTRHAHVTTIQTTFTLTPSTSHDLSCPISVIHSTESPRRTQTTAFKFAQFFIRPPTTTQSSSFHTIGFDAYPLLTLLVGHVSHSHSPFSFWSIGTPASFVSFCCEMGTTRPYPRIIPRSILRRKR